MPPLGGKGQPVTADGFDLGPTFARLKSSRPAYLTARLISSKSARCGVTVAQGPQGRPPELPRQR
jgi:hypothetical protein